MIARRRVGSPDARRVVAALMRYERWASRRDYEIGLQAELIGRPLPERILLVMESQRIAHRNCVEHARRALYGLPQ